MNMNVGDRDVRKTAHNLALTHADQCTLLLLFLLVLVR
jgi:hypothetical protein